MRMLMPGRNYGCFDLSPRPRDGFLRMKMYFDWRVTFQGGIIHSNPNQICYVCEHGGYFVFSKSHVGFRILWPSTIGVDRQPLVKAGPGGKLYLVFWG